jgi:hypothetical protein
MNFPSLSPLKYHSLTPLVYVFSSLSALLKPARSPLPSQKHTCYKVSPSQHIFTEPGLSYSSGDILMPFLFTISLKFPHSSPPPFLPFLPLKNIHVIKSLHHNIDSQNLDLSYSSRDTLMPFHFTISLKFPHSSPPPFLPFFHKLLFRISF